MHAIKQFDNGFKYLEVQNEAASAKIALQGAHIFHYQVKDERPLLWLSEKSTFEEGIAIRGGIPLCWPRFGNLDKTLPQHGFARIFMFELIDVKEHSDTLTQVHLRLKSSKKSREIWDFDFVLDVAFSVSERLEISMQTTNTDIKEFSLTQAFHTYFSVSDISDVTITGLENVEFLDTLIDEKKSENKALIINREVDRVYLGTYSEIQLLDIQRCIDINAKGSNSVIVWNPWVNKCKSMSYMSDEAYKKFVCIENANAFDDFKVLAAQSQTLLSISLGSK